MKLDFNSIPKFCINLKRSEGRYMTVFEEFRKHNIQNVTFFPAVDKRDLIVPEISVKKPYTEAAGVLACAMSHIAVIKHAKEMGHPAICVFEDDVIFCDDFQERIEYIENLDGFEFDILSLGGHFPKEEITGLYARPSEWKNMYRVREHGGTYALIFTEKTYDYIIRNWNYNMGADEFYGNHVYRHFMSYAFVPFLVACRKCESDITGIVWEYANIFWHYKQQGYPGLVSPAPLAPGLPQRYFKDVTFIIPVKIESEDRKFNFLRVIQHLCDTLDTNIIIYESDIDSKVMHLLKQIDRRDTIIEHIFDRNENEVFHRTRYLNIMLQKSRTPVTVNYDIDVLLPAEAYFHARERIIHGDMDLVYPFNQGADQLQVTFPNKDNYKAENLMDPQYCQPWGSLCGHVQFFKTESYINGGMENENFISYGAEDRERMNRFLRLGYKVEWSPFKVYHLEHSRGLNSSVQNTWYHHNEALYNRLNNMERDEIIEYYKNQEYIKTQGVTENLFAQLRRRYL